MQEMNAFHFVSGSFGNQFHKVNIQSSLWNGDMSQDNDDTKNSDNAINKLPDTETMNNVSIHMVDLCSFKFIRVYSMMFVFHVYYIDK